MTIALEPEAAAFYVKHLPLEKRLDGEAGDLFKTFDAGSKYIVVDAGGMYAVCDNVRERGWGSEPLTTVLYFTFFRSQLISYYI